MAVSKLRKSGYTYDKRTGRKRRVNLKRSRVAKKAARSRRHKKLKPTTKLKISKAIKATLRRHRTKSGRRVLRKATLHKRIPRLSKRTKVTPRRSRSFLVTSPISTFHDV